MTTHFTPSKGFIPCIKIIARSSFRMTDDRTSSIYFISDDNLVYSGDRNYSMLFNGGGVTIDKFYKIFESKKHEYAISELIN
jgi:hypothetical protein